MPTMRALAPALDSPARGAVARRIAARLVVVASLLGFIGTVGAAPKKQRYHFELAAVTAKPEVDAKVAVSATPRVEAVVKKAFETHPQLVATLDGAPDKGNEAAYRKYLTKKKLAGAYLVTVEITEAEEAVEVMESKAKTQRMTVKLAVHVLGETIPGRTMGFTGDGKATIKQEIGMKVRDRDREYAWEQAADLAIADAMSTVFKQLAIPAKKP